MSPSRVWYIMIPILLVGACTLLLWWTAQPRAVTLDTGVHQVRRMGRLALNAYHERIEQERGIQSCWQMPKSAWQVTGCRGPDTDCWCSELPQHAGRYGHVDGGGGSLDLYLCQPLEPRQ